ncbi:MAG: universal stress protein [Syntrophomonas sp.]|nr:universal stress protein [Syntrophomonas sp.]
MIKIIIPVDGSPGSDKAVEFALFLSEGKEKEIILLNIQPGYNTPNIKILFSQEQIRSLQEEESQAVFAHTLELTPIASAPFRTRLRIGDPGREICTEAKESKADYIVMGYRGLGSVKRAIMGSVATHVLHETPCPVVIVP